MKGRNFFLLLSIFYFFSSFCIAQSMDASESVEIVEEAVEEIVEKEPVPGNQLPINLVQWDLNEKVFALCDNEAIFLYNAEKVKTQKKVPFNKTLAMSFTEQDEKGDFSLYAISADGIMNVWKVTEKNMRKKSSLIEAPVSVALGSVGNITNAAFSNNGGDSVAIVQNDRVFVFPKLRNSNKITSFELLGNGKSIFSMSFSLDNKFLLAASTDNKIVVWNVKDKEIVTKLNFDSENLITPFFTTDSNGVICQTSEKEICLFNFYGTVINKITTKDKILSVKYISTEDKVILKTVTDNLEIYKLSSEAFLGYIPPYNESGLKDFSISQNRTEILLLYKDNSLIKLNFDDVFIKEGAEPTKVRIYSSNMVNGGVSNSSVAPPSEEPVDEAENLTGAPVEQTIPTGEQPRTVSNSGGYLTISRERTLEFGFVCSMLNESYKISLGGDFSWRSTKKTAPMFIGAGLRVFYGIPDDDFPYTYTYNNEDLAAPNLISAQIYFPFGVRMLLPKNLFYAFAEMDICCSFLVLTSNVSAFSKIFPSFGGRMKIGLTAKFFSFSVGFEYDTTLKFLPQIQVTFCKTLK